MQNGARYQAILEILTEVFEDKIPADKIINDYVRSRSYIGSKDRRFIIDFVWRIIRNRLKLSFDARSGEPRRILLYALKDKLEEVFDGSTYGMTPLTDKEKAALSEENEEPYPDYVEAECPEWLFSKIKDMAFFKALNEPATTDLRAHGISREELKQKLLKEGIETSFGRYAPQCLQMTERLVLNNCMAWQDGLFDVQGEASQIAVRLAEICPEHKIIDYCCGAGGKALAMSDILHNQGHILAYDIDPKRLEALKPRMARLKVKDIELTDIIADSDKEFDRFILDAPCSGSGTWRRAPDAKFRLTESKLKILIRTQVELLEIAARKTRSGGRIVYMTCSVLRDENESVIEAFVHKYPQFRPMNLKNIWAKTVEGVYPSRSEQYLRLSPLATGTDGFFVCVLENQI